MELVLTERSQFGTNESKRLRSNGFTPVTINKFGGESLHASVPSKALESLISDYRFLNTVIKNVVFQGNTISLLPSEVSFHPVSGNVIHIEFRDVSKLKEVSVLVPLNLSGKSQSPGLKFGGKLNVIRYNLEIVAPVDSIPESITIDLSRFRIGKTVKSSSVSLPDGCRFTKEYDILSITGRGRKSKDDAQEAN